jgi:hypothetical protein
MTRAEYRDWSAQQPLGWKLREYFRLPSVRHYLIIWADREQIVHHRRNDAGAIETTVLTSGAIGLHPPGIAITVEEINAD